MKDWIDVLREECERYGQAATARKLEVSASTVNQVVRGKYKGSLANIQIKVEAELMGRTVACPVLGETSLTQCLENKALPYTGSSHFHVRLWRACRDCGRNK